MLGTTKLGQRNTLLLAYAAVLIAVASCQLVAGIENRKVDPLLPGCALPNAAGFPSVRVGNFVPTSDVIDVCIRPAGTSNWGRPVLLNGGTDSADGSEKSCATTLGGAQGFAYGQVSVTFSAPGTNVDVKFIAGGSTCSASAIAEADGVSLATNAVTTLLNMGGNGAPNQLVALPEVDSNANQSVTRVRFVHAAPGTGPLDFGTAASATLPTTIQATMLSQPVPYGGTIPAGAQATASIYTLEDNGYLDVFTGGFIIGAKLDGASDNKALFAFQLPDTSETVSMYALGVAGDNLHPLRALVCNEDKGAGANPLLVPCAASGLSSISVDMFNPALYGPNSPFFVNREDKVAPAIAARDSDVICLAEVDTAKDQGNILKAAKDAGYQYSYHVDNLDLSTAFNDPKDQKGNTPPAPSAPPCSGVDPNLVNGAISCGETNCSTQPAGDGTGVLNGSTDCLIQNCPAQFLNLQGATPNGVACYECMVVYIASDTNWETVQSNCTTDSRAPLGFNGNSNSMILSRYPLNNSDIWVLPATLYRRAVLYSQVQLEDQSFDFYCGFLITTLNYKVLPYLGNYGNGETDPQKAWEAEQLLEAQQVATYVQKKSGTGSNATPAIVVGEWRSSLAPSDPSLTAPPGGNLPTDLAPNTMNFFGGLSSAGWTPATAQDWKTHPQCNFCPTAENLYNGTGDSYFVSQPFLVNWPGDPSTAAISESLLYTDTTVSLPGDAGAGPISPYYGVNVRVLRPH